MAEFRPVFKEAGEQLEQPLDAGPQFFGKSNFISTNMHKWKQTLLSLLITDTFESPLPLPTAEAEEVEMASASPSNDAVQKLGHGASVRLPACSRSEPCLIR